MDGEAIEALISKHRVVQRAAKAVLEMLPSTISAASTEASIAASAYAELCRLGYPETWYYSCPALVLLGSRSCESESGRKYVPALEPVGAHNLITIDLSPVWNGHWGDCARSFYVQDGVVVNDPTSPDLAEGKAFLEALHAEMKTFVTIQTAFRELFHWANDRITRHGFENLDFLGNVGHSIASCREDRLYIEADNERPLKDATLFTFEPHVKKCRGRWGFKHENIFFFDQDGRLAEL